MTTTELATQHGSPFKPGDRVIYQDRHIGTLERVNHEFRDDHWFITWDDGTPTRLPRAESDFRWLTPEDQRLSIAGVGEFAQDIKESLDSGAGVQVTTAVGGRIARKLKDRGYSRNLKVDNKQTLNDLIDRAMRRGGQLVAVDNLGETWIFSEDEDENRHVFTPNPSYYDAVTVEHIHFPVRIINDGVTR
jgi:hypothetical protein